MWKRHQHRYTGTKKWRLEHETKVIEVTELENKIINYLKERKRTKYLSLLEYCKGNSEKSVKWALNSLKNKELIYTQKMKGAIWVMLR